MSETTLKEALVRADRLIEAMFKHVGQMAVSGQVLADANDHFIYMSQQRRLKFLPPKEPYK